MSRTGENIYRRKDGRWEGRYIEKRINGKAKYKSVYAKNYKELKIKLNKARAENAHELVQAKAGSTEDIGKKWLKICQKQLKRSSVNKYEDNLRLYILPEFGGMDFSDITNKMLINFIESLQRGKDSGGKGLSSATISSITSTLNNLRTFALKNDYYVAFSTDCFGIKQEKKEIRVFTVLEEQRLINYLFDNLSYTSVGILLCLYTGIRVGELCALKWDDIDLTEKTLIINKTMQRIRQNEKAERKTVIEIMKPKSSCSIRVIPIPDEVIQVLRNYYKAGTFILTGEKENYIEPRTMQYRYKQILDKCNIQNASFHTMRHSFATRCVEAGFDVKSLSEILGHASVAITMNRYVHPSMNAKAENMRLFSKLFTVTFHGQADEK